MPCYRPLSGWLAKSVNPTGKRSIVFEKSRGFSDKPVSVPCGQCIGCRLERSRQWAIRCLHESELHDENCFLTLTYDDEHLPDGGTLVLSDFQKFMKRLRKFAKKPIRFFHCGEYGEKTSRPHYHCCLFGFDFPDKVLWKVTSGGKLYVSEIAKTLWPFGYSVIGGVTFESACYIARYIVKKVTGKRSVEAYEGRIPEYLTMSRRPGIARGWYEKFKGDVFPSDEVIINGRAVKPPKFYTSILELEDSNLFSALKANRAGFANSHWSDNLSDRLKTRENYAESKLNTFSKRSLNAD